MYAEDELLPISSLQHLLFCERRAALVCLEGLWEDNISTTEGSLLHERTHQPETESRNDLRIARGLWLRSLRLGLYGKADVVEFRILDADDKNQGIALTGELGFWSPYPVEYKRGRLRSEASFEIQLCAQGLCLEEMLGIKVASGALYYGKTRRRMEINFDKALRERTESAALRIHEIFDSRITPDASPRPKCRFCSLNSLCLPKISRGRKSIRRYLKHTIKE
jgi:CRISPR-associated exonuclease Cas4